MASVFETKLEDQSTQYWANSILYRLAAAIGLVDRDNPEDIELDADELLEEVEFRLALFGTAQHIDDLDR